MGSPILHHKNMKSGARLGNLKLGNALGVWGKEKCLNHGSVMLAKSWILAFVVVERAWIPSEYATPR
ncbi:hypothetical protein CCP4SC76_5750001 [Gammaproteobacteria bacterium]